VASSFEAGRRLGPYVLDRLLGRGGSGEVWEATLHGPGGFEKLVALKMLRGRGGDDPDLRDLLLREARLGARLHHPNVVSTLLVAEHEGTVCVALELVRGTSLHRLLKARGPLPAGAVLDVGVQAARALHHVHTFRYRGQPAGLVHRDVKPANLLVDTRGTVKLADLGISVRTGEAGPVAGTPGYMSPEQLDGEATPRSDLFALGATLFALAAARRPLGSGQAALRALVRLERRLADPSFLAPVEESVPGLGRVVRACLREDPARRPADALELARELEALRHRAPPGIQLSELVNSTSDGAAPRSSTSASEPTLALPVGNLRPSRDAFIGRKEELRRSIRRVEGHRWVVLLGPGGVGKTRLATELTRRLQHDFPGGVWAFDLTEARSVLGVCAAVAGALGVQLSGDPVAQLGHLFAHRGRCLVVLDNLEQCVDALEGTVAVWRALAPEAHILGTSRVRPGLRDEVVVPLAGLEPDDAAWLFRERAGRALTAAEEASLPELCRVLECMPLPLELAAARAALLPVDRMLERVSLALLSTAARDRPARQRSVVASLQWSWELLSAPARRAWAQLCVFDGGFDLAGAEAVVCLGPDDPWALDVLTELVDASLVRVDPATGRFSMWVAVREFGADKLSDEERRAAEVRHGEHVAQPSATPVDLDNIVVACRRAVARGDASVAVQTLQRACLIFGRTGPFEPWVELTREVAAAFPRGPQTAAIEVERALAAEQVRALDEALAACEHGIAEAVRHGDEITEAKLWQRSGSVCLHMGNDQEAIDRLRRALSIQERISDHQGAGSTCSDLAYAHVLAGREAPARRRMARALRLHEVSATPHELARTLSTAAVLHVNFAEYASAEATTRRALAAFQAAGDPRSVATLTGNLATVMAFGGDTAEAARLWTAALDMHRAHGDLASQTHTLGNLAELHLRRGRYAQASKAAEEATAIAVRTGDVAKEAWARARLGTIRARQGRLDAGRRELERSLELYRATADRRFDAGVQASLGMVELQAGEVDRARRHLEEATRATASLPAGVRLAKVRLARLEATVGRVEVAAALLDETERSVEAEPFALAVWRCVAAVVAHRRGQEDRAAALLARVESTPNRIQEDLEWARRTVHG